MATFRIISFDGGGIKGALSARLLVRITERYPDLLKHTQLFAGTSTGSFIALGLANNLSPQAISDLYSIKNSSYIFTPSHNNLFQPKYKNDHLQEVLARTFGRNLKLSALPKKVVVPAFNVKGYHSQGFNTVFFHNLTSNPTSREKVVDTALYSSAAPTYFPSYNNFIDGGVAANSPTIAPVLLVRSLYPSTYTLNNFRLLSIGTGSSTEYIDLNTANWGISQWMYNPKCNLKQPLVSILFDAPATLDNLYSEELLGKNFFRIDPYLSEPIELDDYKKIPYLLDVADSVDLSATFRYIEQHFLRD